MVENIGSLLDETPGIKKKTAKELIDQISSSCLELDNTRFNGYAKDGLNLNTIDHEELKEILTNFSESQEKAKESGENGEGILADSYFYVSCCCGNFVSFLGPENIPHSNLHCDLCNRVLIDYTGKHDFEFEYDEE